MRKNCLLVLASALCVSISAALYVPLPASADALGQTCTRADADVALSAQDTASHHVAGWLCWRGALQDQTLQFLTSGLTYDHTYWDWPAA